MTGWTNSIATCSLDTGQFDTGFESAISPDKFHVTPWHLEGQLTDWMREGMGIERLPTTAMALMPIDSPVEALDPVRVLVRNAAIQRACISFASEMPETAGHAPAGLRYFLHHIHQRQQDPSPRSPRVTRSRHNGFRLSYARSSMFAPSLASARTWSRELPCTAPIAMQVLALHMCVQLDKKILFYDEHSGSDTFGYSELQRAACDLQDAFIREQRGRDSSSPAIATFDWCWCVPISASKSYAATFSLRYSKLWVRFCRRHPVSDEVQQYLGEELSTGIRGVPFRSTK